MTDEQQTAKYINGLKYPIQKCVILHDVFSIDEAHNNAIKIERLQDRAVPFKSTAEKTSGNKIALQRSTSGERPPTHKATDAPPANLTTAIAPTTKVKENPYTKLRVDKCYRHRELEHKSDECPKRRFVNMTDYDDEDEVLIETESEDSDFVEEGEAAIVVTNRCYDTNCYFRDRRLRNLAI